METKMVNVLVKRAKRNLRSMNRAYKLVKVYFKKFKETKNEKRALKYLGYAIKFGRIGLEYDEINIVYMESLGMNEFNLVGRLKYNYHETEKIINMMESSYTRLKESLGA